MAQTPTNLPYIGDETLVTLAHSMGEIIALRPWLDHKPVFEKMHIKVFDKIDYQQIDYIMLVKGHTSRRKIIGQTMANTLGFVKERKLITYLSWDRFFSNKDAFRETPLRDKDGNLGYPRSINAIQLATQAYSDNLYDCIWWGDAELGELNADGSEKPNAEMGMYDGFHTCLNRDIVNGIIKPIHLTNEPAWPANVSDTMAYDAFVEFHDKWDVHLQSVPVVVYCSVKVAASIRKAYSNTYGNQMFVNTLPNGNFVMPEFPLVEIASDPSYGVGTRMVATVYDNFQYGIDSLNPQTTVEVEFGGYGDARTVVFQPQSAQGTRVMDPRPTAIAVTDGDLDSVKLAGDYDKDLVIVKPSDDTLGSITVNGEEYTEAQEFARGTVLTLKATAGTGQFVGWSNGAKTEEITVVATGTPMVLVAIFKEQ